MSELSSVLTLRTAGSETASAPSKSGEAELSARREIDSPPVIVLGGEANALSVVRSLGRRGVRTYAMGDAESVVRRSRYCQWIAPPLDGGLEASWARWLLGRESDHLKGAIILACGDAGIRVIARHREALIERFILDDSHPQAQIAMLDKVTTYQNAVAAGVPTPRFWLVESRKQVLKLRDELVFPLIVKPRLSHVFEEKFGKKYLNAPSFEEVLSGIDAANAAGVEVLLMEWIPGPDTRLCSYFTYLDAKGNALFHFTKRIIRRYPAGMGPACYHVTDWIPELVDPSLKLFRHVGLCGLANVEYKQDERDGKYKIIECNARFVASNALVAAAGMDLARFVYNRLAGQHQPAMERFRIGMHMWDPGRDWTAYRELRAAGEITFPQWAGSVMHRQTFPWFSWSDPLPAVARAIRGLKK